MSATATPTIRLGLAPVALAMLLSSAPRAQMVLAPDFTLKNLNGAATTLRQQHGKVVLLNFWATWCPPCRTEIPILMKLRAAYGPERLVVLGVAMDEEGSKVVVPFVQRERFALDRTTAPVNYPVLIGTDAVADAYHVDGLPMTVVIDSTGREVRRIDTAIEFDDIDRSIRSLLGGTSRK
jgi:thiol-disulfide isomerase/thioredoxin